MRIVSSSRLLLTLALSACNSSPAAPEVPAKFNGRCDTVLAPTVDISPGVARQVDNGSCQLTPFGTTVFLGDKVLQLAAGTQSVDVTLTMANGDVLRALGAGTNAVTAPGRVHFVATIKFTGGTGRFAGATGEARAEGDSDLIGRKATFSMDGTVIFN